MMSSPAAAPSMTSMPLLREARLDDYEAIVALERANGLKPRSREEWSRFWTENPLYPTMGGACPIGWVLEEEETGRIVGTLSNVPLPYTFRGRHILAATGRGWAVDPAYRVFAPLLLDEYIHQNADVLLSTTVNGMAEASHTICEQTRVPVGDWTQAAFRIAGYYGFARAALKLKKAPRFLSPLVAAALWIKDRLGKGGALPAKPPGVTVTRATTFGPEFDDFWVELQQLKVGRMLGVRTQAVLAWHFGSKAESGGLHVLSVSGGDGRMRAYAVLVRSDHQESGLRRMRVADFQSLDPALDSALIRAAVDVCRQEGVHALELVGCGLPEFRAWETILPYRRALPAWCYFFHSTDPALMAALHDPEAWAPSSFDGDSSL
ncbi:GNAT family N-acetyltransferase [Paludibaculum fermentans]|uniref:GNAT family N-acetyltransferase n=1 Tax=Paludibaculum fermentans TaxID=1473598 RepID=UPI003EBCA822